MLQPKCCTFQRLLRVVLSKDFSCPHDAEFKLFMVEDDFSFLFLFIECHPLDFSARPFFWKRRKVHVFIFIWKVAFHKKVVIKFAIEQAVSLIECIRQFFELSVVLIMVFDSIFITGFYNISVKISYIWIFYIDTSCLIIADC